MLKLSATISGVRTTNVVADILVSATDQIYSLRYVRRPKEGQIPLAYVGLPNVTTSSLAISNLWRGSLAERCLENGDRELGQRTMTERVFTLPTRGALITNVTAMDGAKTPLFYRHVIKGGFISSPRIFKADGTEVSSDKYKVIIKANEVSVCHNLRSVMTIDGALDVYYISYVSLNRVPVRDLLEAIPVYTEATPITALDRSLSTYAVRDTGLSFRYNILHGNGPWYVQVRDIDQIRLLSPITSPISTSWHVDVSCGEVIAIDGDGNRKRYAVPEYETQQFSPTQPVRYAGTLEAVATYNNIALLPIKNLLIDDDHPIDILITDKDCVPKAAYTTRTGSNHVWTDKLLQWKESAPGIRTIMVGASNAGVSFNRSEGIISFKRNLDADDRVFFKSFNTTKLYSLKTLNLNPTMNSTITDGTAYIYCVPEEELLLGESAINYLVVDKDGLPVDCSQDINLEALIGDTSPISILLDLNRSYMLIGEVSYRRDFSIDDMYTVDVRETEGVLRESIENRVEELSKDYPELLLMSKKGLSSRRLPIRYTTTIEAPYSVVDKFGGPMEIANSPTRSYSKGLMLGAYNRVKLTGADVKIIDATYSNGSLTIRFTCQPEPPLIGLYRSIDGSSGEPTRHAATYENGIGTISVETDDTSSSYIRLTAIINDAIVQPSEYYRFDLKSGNRNEAALSANIVSAPKFTIGLTSNIVRS